MSLDNMTVEEIKFWNLGAKDTLAAIEKNGLYRCPLCSHLTDGKPQDYNICGSCGVEYGYSAPHFPEAQPLWKP